jgi:hypothetical protein
MLRAYRLIITNYEYAPPQLWECEQPHIDNLYRSARTFGHKMKQRFFLNKDALNWENTRIWHTHYKLKPAHDHIASLQELLAEHRQVAAEVLEIAKETGWRGAQRADALVCGKRWG